jgi:hypothetical protein
VRLREAVQRGGNERKRERGEERERGQVILVTRGPIRAKGFPGTNAPMSRNSHNVSQITHYMPHAPSSWTRKNV